LAAAEVEHATEIVVIEPATAVSNATARITHLNAFFIICLLPRVH
jgi:hypothetical protein